MKKQKASFQNGVNNTKTYIINRLFDGNLALAKRMAIMLALTALFFSGIFGFQLFKAHMMKKYMSAMVPIETVSANPAKVELWQPKLQASGSLRAIQGVDVTTELAGLVRNIRFIPGQKIKKGDILVELNADSDIAHLNSLQATVELAAITYNRDKIQYEEQAVSRATVDADLADLTSKQAQVLEQMAIVAKKMITAPFNGRLGICAINEGQYINPGDKIVTLQEVDPIYVDFYIPQQSIIQLAVGKPVVITSDGYPGQSFQGKITAIDPKVDPTTRNVHVQATLCNANGELLPGMFVSVEIHTDAPKGYLTLPQAAIGYNSYGEIVYILVPAEKKDKKGKPIFIATQTFVTLGDTRGDQVAVLKGIKEGDLIVTSGQLKLKNGSQVVINNSVLPENDPKPIIVDE